MVLFLRHGVLSAQGAYGGQGFFWALPDWICGMVVLLLPLVRCCFGSKVSDVFDLNKLFNQMIKFVRSDRLIS
jgi:ABC-type tungstate transport system substrate-binding protein